MFKKKNIGTFAKHAHLSFQTQVQVVVVSMPLHNHIKIKTQDDNAFIEFDHHRDFIPNYILTNVMAHSQSHPNH